MMNNY